MNETRSGDIGALVGIVSRDAIVQYLELRRGLGVDTPKSDTQNQFRNAAWSRWQKD